MRTIYVVDDVENGQLAFLTEEEAEQAAKGQGEWETAADVNPVTLYESMEEYRRELRAKVLSRLNPAERAAMLDTLSGHVSYGEEVTRG